jgi:RNA polymerase primary sigma factor
MIGTIHKLVRTSRSRRQKTGKAPDVDELAVRLNLPPRVVAEALKIAKGLVSMERPFGEPADDEAEAAEDARAGRPDALTAREERVLCMRFDIALEADPALEELGRQLLESRKRLREVEARARRTLKPKKDPEAS